MNNINKEDKFRYGSLSRYTLTKEERDLFIEYLDCFIGSPALEFVRYLLGDDYLKFIDILAGTSFKIPSSRFLERDLSAIKMFTYAKDNDFTEESIRTVAKMYGKTVLQTKKLIYRIAKYIGVEDLLDGELLNNYITNIKIPANKVYIQNKTDKNDIDINKDEIDESYDH